MCYGENQGKDEGFKSGLYDFGSAEVGVHFLTSDKRQSRLIVDRIVAFVIGSVLKI